MPNLTYLEDVTPEDFDLPPGEVMKPLSRHNDTEDWNRTYQRMLQRYDPARHGTKRQYFGSLFPNMTFDDE